MSDFKKRAELVEAAQKKRMQSRSKVEADDKVYFTLRNKLLADLAKEILAEVIQQGTWVASNHYGIRTFSKVVRSLPPTLKALRKLDRYNTSIDIPVAVRGIQGCFLELRIYTQGRRYELVVSTHHVRHHPPIGKILRAAKMKVDIGNEEDKLTANIAKVERAISRLQMRSKGLNAALDALREARSGKAKKR